MRAWLSLLVGLGIAAFPSSFALAGPIAYINGGAVLSVIDTATNAVVANVGVGRGPQGVAANPAGTRDYVAKNLSSDVSIIDTASNTVVETIQTAGGAFALGQFVGPEPTASPVIEYYHAGFDHYFITWMPNEIAILDAGTPISSGGRCLSQRRDACLSGLQQPARRQSPLHDRPSGARPDGGEGMAGGG
jgi:YVTN family beta-propeller protein